MNPHFTAADIMLIEKEITAKPYKDIAFLLDRPVSEVRAFIDQWLPGKNILSYQSLLDQKKASRPPVVRKGNARKKKEPVIISRLIDTQQKVKRSRSDQPVYKTKEVNLSAMQQVRIDHKTWIYIKPGQDPQKARAKYLSRLKEHNSSIFTNKEAV